MIICLQQNKNLNGCVTGLSRRYRQRAADGGPHRGGRPRVDGGQPGPADHPAPAQQAALLQNIIGDRNTRVAGRKSSSWYRYTYSFFNFQDSGFTYVLLL